MAAGELRQKVLGYDGQLDVSLCAAGSWNRAGACRRCWLLEAVLTPSGCQHADAGGQ